MDRDALHLRLLQFWTDYKFSKYVWHLSCKNFKILDLEICSYKIYIYFGRVRKNKQELNPRFEYNILNRSPTSKVEQGRKDYRQRHIGHRDGLSQEHHVKPDTAAARSQTAPTDNPTEESSRTSGQVSGQLSPEQSPERGTKPTAFPVAQEAAKEIS